MLKFKFLISVEHAIREVDQKVEKLLGKKVFKLILFQNYFKGTNCGYRGLSRL